MHRWVVFLRADLLIFMMLGVGQVGVFCVLVYIISESLNALLPNALAVLMWRPRRGISVRRQDALRQLLFARTSSKLFKYEGMLAEHVFPGLITAMSLAGKGVTLYGWHIFFVPLLANSAVELARNLASDTPVSSDVLVGRVLFALTSGLHSFVASVLWGHVWV